MKKRHTLRIKRHTYRGRDGFLIFGRPSSTSGGWPVKIFTGTAESARTIKAKLIADPYDESIDRDLV